MYWFYLGIAAIFETGWPVGLKLAALPEYSKVLWIVISIITMTLSGIFLYLAQKGIPIGTAYAIWSGAGASCTFLIGVWFFNDAANLLRILGIIFILIGVILLKVGN